MNPLESYLDDRDERRKMASEDAGKSRVDWMLAGATPETRLSAFDTWVIEQLDKRLIWAADDAGKERRIFQCRVELERMLTQFYSRGWLLDGRRIANHVTTVLDAIGAAQRSGKVVDFWPYFKAAVSRYAGANAEEIRAESQRAGNLMGSVLGALGVTSGDSIVELVATRRSEIVEAKTLREKISDERRKAVLKGSQKDQLKFL